MVDTPDLYSFLQAKLFRALVSAMCGPIIFHLSLNFTKEF